MKKIKLKLSIAMFMAIFVSAAAIMNPLGSINEKKLLDESIVAVKEKKGVKVLFDIETLKRSYGESIADHFDQTAILKNITLENFNLGSVAISKMKVKEGESVNYLTFFAEFDGLNLTIAVPIFKGYSNDYFYTTIKGSGVPDGIGLTVFDCACSTHSCAGTNCSECKFTEDSGGCITGCMCNRSSGGGSCDHTVTTLPPGSCAIE